MDYNSKYTGEQVEELLDKINGSPEDIAIPTGNYPDMTVGKASQADTATIAINADNATKAASATTAEYATTAGVAESAEHATTAESATHAGAATKADFATDLTGRNEATAEEFTLRPSAGNISIRDDSATIKRIKGNSIVWNQMISTPPVMPYTNRCNLSISGNDINATVNSIEYDYVGFYYSLPDYRHPKTVNGHTYFISGLFSCPKQATIAFGVGSSSITQLVPANTLYSYNTIQKQTSDAVGAMFTCWIEDIQVDDTFKVQNWNVIDLTQMFGAGNEPDTVEEFRALFPGNHYEHNPGQLVSMSANGLFTNGFNQWDEQWKVGQISSATGNVVVAGGNKIKKIISKNYIPVLPNTSYFLTLPLPQDDSHGVYYYDENKNYIGFQWIARDVNQKLFTTPSNCLFIKFDSWGTTYNNDICINLSHTGVENGKYEPYWDVTKDLSVIQKYFPNGMRSAGSIYDEISFDETTQKWVAIQRVGNVDLGSLSWAYSEHLFGGETVAGFKTSIEDIIFANTATTLPNITVSKYNINTADKVANGYAATETFTGYKAYKTDLSAYFTFTTDASEFKSSLSGVMLNYELAEPIITVIEEPINLSYKVGDFGIEQILSDSFSAPFRADIIYQFNATDRIRENSLNIEKLSKTQNEYLPLTGGTMSGQINSQDIKPVEDNTYQLGDSTHKYKNVFSDFFTGNLEGNAKTATVATDLSGRVEATPEVFTYHPSAGEKSIKDDNAFIRRVKGNSVVFNQMLKNGNFATTTDWSPYQSTNVSLNWDNGLTVTSNYAGTGNDPISVRQAIAQPFILGHKYFVHFEFSTSNTSLTPLVECFNALYSNEKKLDYVQSGNHYYSINNVKATLTTDCYLKAMGTKAVGDTWTFKDVMIIDLTAMFGSGNEPATVEEFRALYPDSYYPYNPGELRNFDCSGIKTVGFNQWDEQWEYGYFTQDGKEGTNTTHIKCKNYIPVISGATYYAKLPEYVTDLNLWAYDENFNYVATIHPWKNTTFTIPQNAKYCRFYVKTGGNPYNNNICINLHHTGWRDGDYEPYKEVTHSLPLSQITNGEPLRKAGSVYDEINETEYIKRVGVVDMGSLTWVKNAEYNLFACNEIPNMIATTDAALRLDGLFCTKYAIDTILSIDAAMSEKTMKRNYGWLYIKDTSFTDVASFKASLSGVILNYELAEPIVTPIETPIDFNYYVEDFGTEEALLAEDSAPFSADIVYQFNATDQIRNNTRNINKLQKSAFTPSGTSAQYIRGDGSYGDKVELSQSTPINNGEFETTDEGDRQFILTPNYYARSQVTLDNTTTIAVFVTAPENSNYLAEYWFEFAVDDTLPNIEYYQPNNSKAVFRIDGDMMTGAVNILHLISSDGGNTFFGEIRSYSL